MALYILIAIDGHSESQVVSTFLLSTEDKPSLQQMIAKFKEKNGNWKDIKCVITDKDMTERLNCHRWKCKYGLSVEK